MCFSKIATVCIGDDGDGGDRTRLGVGYPTTLDGNYIHKDGNNDVFDQVRFPWRVSGKNALNWFNEKYQISDDGENLYNYMPGICLVLLIHHKNYGNRYQFVDGYMESKHNAITANSSYAFTKMPFDEFKGLN